MPKNPDLVPTVIVDVNGRTTVVHKLRKMLSSTSKRSGSKMPVPSIPGERAWKSTIVKTLMKTAPSAAGLTDKDAITKMEKNLFMNFTESSLRFFCEVMAREDGTSAAVAKQLAQCKFPDDNSARIVADRLEKKIRTNIMFCDSLNTDDYDEIKELVLGLRQQLPFYQTDLWSLNERRWGQAVAVVKATKRLTEEYPASIDNESHPVDQYSHSVKGWESLVLDVQLFEMVMSRPEDMDQIVDAVIENKTSNPEIINGVMMGISAPLADGAL